MNIFCVHSCCLSALIAFIMLLPRVSVASLLSRRFFCSSSKNNGLTSAAIAELNKEMESVFGEPPSRSVADSSSSYIMEQGARSADFAKTEMTEVGLTHVGTHGEAQMVDVACKETSKRIAVASGRVLLGKKVFDMVSSNQMAKGDVLTVAKIAGINGAKQTSNLIPLCHNISLTHLRVDLMLNADDFSVEIEGEAASTGQTGVEMEALTAVSVAGLTVYDMCKAVSKEIQIADIRLERKTGGKSGDWSRQE